MQRSDAGTAPTRGRRTTILSAPESGHRPRRQSASSWNRARTAGFGRSATKTARRGTSGRKGPRPESFRGWLFQHSTANQGPMTSSNRTFGASRVSARGWMNRVPTRRGRAGWHHRALFIERHRLEPHLEHIALEGRDQGEAARIAISRAPATRRPVGEITRPTVVDRSIIAGRALAALDTVVSSSFSPAHRRPRPPVSSRGLAASRYRCCTLALPYRHQMAASPATSRRPAERSAIRGGGCRPPADVERGRVRDQLPSIGDKRGILGLLVGFVGVDHELEAADAVRDRDRHIGRRGAAPTSLGWPSGSLATSITSHRVDEVVPSNETPIKRRAALRPPSQPTT